MALDGRLVPKQLMSTGRSQAYRYLQAKRMSIVPTLVPPTAGLRSTSVCTNSVGPSSVSGMGDAAATVSPALASAQQVALAAGVPPSSDTAHCAKSSPA